MAELKTKKNDASVEAYLDNIPHEGKKKDAKRIHVIMKTVSKDTPRMWGDSIVGYGDYHYKYASGREGDWFRIGFSARKQSMSLYLMSGVNKHPHLLKDLGKHKTGKGCLYINKLADVNEDILIQLIEASYANDPF